MRMRQLNEYTSALTTHVLTAGKSKRIADVQETAKHGANRA